MAEIPNRTLQRGLEMLELLSENSEGLALCDLSQRLRLPRSSAFNIAHSLIALGYAQQDNTGRYILGLKMFEIGAQAVNRTNIMDVIRACMSDVHRQINETMHLGVRSGLETLYIDKLDSTQSIRMSSFVGARAPLHCTALGKALLSLLSDEEIRALYKDEPLVAVTKKSITKLDELVQQVQTIRQRGYAVESEEYNDNVCCVAIPLQTQKYGRDGERYALSVSAPIFRMDDNQIQRVAELLLQAQARVERFGHAPR